MDDDLKQAKANERRRVRRLQMVAALGGVGATAGVLGVGIAKSGEGWMALVGVVLALAGLGAVIASFSLAGRFLPDGDTIRVENARGGYRDSLQSQRAYWGAYAPLLILFPTWKSIEAAWAIAGRQAEALHWMMVGLGPLCAVAILLVVAGFDNPGDRKMKRLLEDELTLSFRRSALSLALGVALAGMVVVFALGLWKPQAAVAAMPGLMFVTASAAGLRYWQLDRRAAGG